jgi:hypothetical protein
MFAAFATQNGYVIDYSSVALGHRTRYGIEQAFIHTYVYTCRFDSQIKKRLGLTVTRHACALSNIHYTLVGYNVLPAVDLSDRITYASGKND